MNETLLLQAQMIACEAIIEAATTNPEPGFMRVAFNAGRMYHLAANEIATRTGVDPRPTS